MALNVDEKPPYRHVAFPPVDLNIERRDDGVMVMTPRTPLEVEAVTVAEGVTRGAAISPDKTAIAERNAAGGWTEKSFKEFLSDIRNAAQWLLDNGAGPETPVMVISGNSIAHATLRFAALTIGAPIAPVSENYALLGARGGFERLKHAVGLIKPRFILAETEACAPAALACAGDATVISRAPDAMPGAVSFDTLLETQASDDVTRAAADIDPDAPAAYLLTSGSTGKPKAVIHTNRMMTACIAQGWWVVKDTGTWNGLILEWLPWSHVSGLYVSMATALVGGAYYIDRGRPMPGLFDESIRNIRDLPLTYYTSVPAGYAMLADAMEQDPSLRDVFFKNMQVMLFGGAAMPQPLYDRLQSLAIEATGERISVVAGYGATETTSGCMSTYFHTEQAGIGLPLPGLELKLLPYGDKYELRMRGVVIAPGYLGTDDLRENKIDEEGYYCTGDTAEFIDPDTPESGLRFAGRISDEFKLNTGTWVAGGSLRVDLLKILAPDVVEVLVCGESRDRIGILAWLSPLASADVLDEVRGKIEAFNAENKTSSRKIRRFGVLTSPPDPECGELSDKGSVNQSLTIGRRRDDVDKLFATLAPDGVLVFD